MNGFISDDLIAPFRHKTVPVHRLTYWYFFGGITLFLFGVQVITGILLLLYYNSRRQRGLRERAVHHD